MIGTAKITQKTAEYVIYYPDDQATVAQIGSDTNFRCCSTSTQKYPDVG